MNNYKFLIAVIFSLLFVLPVFSQKRDMKKADEAINIGEYKLAYELYEKAYEKLSDKDIKAEVAFNLGECARIMMDERKAAKWYKKAVRGNINNPKAYLYYADALKMLEKLKKDSLNN